MGKVNTLAEIAKEIKRHTSIVVVSHYSPDPDAFGSSCGLTIALKNAGKQVVCVNQDGAVSDLFFIPGAADIKDSFPTPSPELLIACDCGDGRRVGENLTTRMHSFKTIINIDHHASNDLFGHLNYVIADASSTSELILDLLEEMRLVVTPEVATCLYYGLSADTGSFRYSATSAKTFNAASRLVGYGAKPAEVAQTLYQSIPFEQMKLQAEALLGMEQLFDGKVIEITVTEDMAKKHGCLSDDGDDLKHLSQCIRGGIVSVIYRRVDNLWRISARSKSDAIDVAKLAEKFGGGGHKAAAGFRWRGELAELKVKLHEELKRSFS